MARNPFTYIKTNPEGKIKEEEALRLVFYCNPEDWKDYCDDADKRRTRVAECMPHDLVVREKQKLINQMLAQIACFEPHCKIDPQRMNMLNTLKSALSKEWK